MVLDEEVYELVAVKYPNRAGRNVQSQSRDQPRMPPDKRVGGLGMRLPVPIVLSHCLW